MTTANQVIKQDTGKPDFTLILGPLRQALTAMVRVREFGERKYRAAAEAAGEDFDPCGWRKVEARRYLASAARHLIAVIDGERVNHEDGDVEHIAQAMVDLGFAYEIEAALLDAPISFEVVCDLDPEPCPSTQRSARDAIPPPVPQEVNDRGWQWRPVGDGAFAPPFGTIRQCDCGCLVGGGPSRCTKCATEPCDPPTPAPEAQRPPLIDIAAGAALLKLRSFVWDNDGKRQPLIVRSFLDLPSLSAIVGTMRRKRRWDGQCDEAITLLEHSIMVARIARDLVPVGEQSGPEFQRLIRSCQLHDAAETLYGDIPTPRKHLERAMLPPGIEHPNDQLTREFDRLLSLRYDLDLRDPRIKQADTIACCWEAIQRGNLSEGELAQGFSDETVKAARELRLYPIGEPLAAWWYMWRRAGGDCSEAGEKVES